MMFMGRVCPIKIELIVGTYKNKLEILTLSLASIPRKTLG
jgi:hypothetical protein